MRKEKYDIEQYFYVKVKEFRELLQDRKSEEVNAKKEKLKIANKQQERKREEIRVRLEEEELERIRKSNMKYEENCRNKLKDIVESTFSKYKTIKAVEDNKYFKEISQKKSKQKELIKENIKNLYDDKIRMMREKMTERKLYQRVFEMEHKAACSEAQKSRRTQCKLLHENNKRLLQKQSELIELEAKEEVETIFKKILQFYKKSAPSRGQKS